MDADELMRPADVREILQVSGQTLRRWAASGLLTPIKFTTRTYRYRREDVEKLVGDAEAS